MPFIFSYHALPWSFCVFLPFCIYLPCTHMPAHFLILSACCHYTACTTSYYCTALPSLLHYLCHTFYRMPAHYLPTGEEGHAILLLSLVPSGHAVTPSAHYSSVTFCPDSPGSAVGTATLLFLTRCCGSYYRTHARLPQFCNGWWDTCSAPCTARRRACTRRTMRHIPYTVTATCC